MIKTIHFITSLEGSNSGLVKDSCFTRKHETSKEIVVDISISLGFSQFFILFYANI